MKATLAHRIELTMMKPVSPGPVSCLVNLLTAIFARIPNCLVILYTRSWTACSPNERPAFLLRSTHLISLNL